MSWYVLQCKTGQEASIIRSCKANLSAAALEDAFVFRCERLWRTGGSWIPLVKDMFPGYVFLQSGAPETLSRELKQFKGIFHVLEDSGYLISVYEAEENALNKLCGAQHILELSFGYRDDEAGRSLILRGPLSGQEDKILKINWHKRIALLEVAVAKRQAVVWAGIDLAPESLRTENVRKNPQMFVS